MNKLLVVLGVAICLSACRDKPEPKFKEAVKIISSYEVLVKYKSRVLECTRVGPHSMTCNWAKYNAEVVACKLEKAKESIVYDKEGNEIIFPPIAGECD
jgi:hypothetical protein